MESIRWRIEKHELARDACAEPQVATLSRRRMAAIESRIYDPAIEDLTVMPDEACDTWAAANSEEFKANIVWKILEISWTNVQDVGLRRLMLRGSSHGVMNEFCRESKLAFFHEMCLFRCSEIQCCISYQPVFPNTTSMILPCATMSLVP